MLAHGRFETLLLHNNGATGVWVKVQRAVLGESSRWQGEGNTCQRDNLAMSETALDINLANKSLLEE